MEKLNNRKEQKCAPPSFLFSNYLFGTDALLMEFCESNHCLHVGKYARVFSPVLRVQPNGDRINTQVYMSLAHACWRWSIACFFRNREHSSYTDMYLFRASLSNSEWKIHSAGSKSCVIITIIRVSNLHIKIPLGNTQVHSLWLEGRF